MVRPKANTPEGRRATEKWRKTMLEKYGGEEGLKHQVKLMGSMGGRVSGIPKGFALDRERAAAAGRKGGLKSRRTGVSTGQGKEKVYYDGTPKTITTPRLDKELESNKKWFGMFRRKNV